MDLRIFSQLNFLPALKALFKDLKVPTNYVADEPISAKEILKDTYKDNETFQLLDDVYFVGMVDDAAFEGNKSLEAEKIKSDYDGILIFGVTLKNRPNGLLPTRSQLAEISRAFNREFYYTPVVVIFKYGNYLAFANTERLKYKQEWREGEKAGKVSLLRDIHIEKPHSGHERILVELQIPTTGTKKVDSFAKLYAYWQEVFSVSLLNKKFYQELSSWYFWATSKVTFPGQPTAADAHHKNAKLEDLMQEHRATNVIRMLTRLLFVWFIKEKKLIPEELFELDALQKDILNEISPYHESGMFKERNKESIYYKAILQNLFFATLNCPIKPDGLDKRTRDFRRDKNYGDDFGNDWLYRYKKHFKNPEKFLTLMNSVVPFLNGGLFECLDEKHLKKYVDGFSDHMAKGEQLIVPDYLFFGVEEETDLSDIVGIKDKKYKQAAVKGLINILKSYKFTITENTPIEEDVALDPELLGKVFENLLASYNPETKTTARKQTGSFYTPREIVNYMVDESLITYLKNALVDWGGLDDETLDKELHVLTSFDSKVPFADNSELQKKIITALSTCTILDPACGSGAFPMGILQKMVHILQKLDPDNKVWKEVQLAKAEQESKAAFEIEDKQAREERLLEINEAFDQSINDPDYARKLFLIENCIYGVDIQPIATQISKLRFFISLVVEQKVNADKDNFGIRPLPNLETKFVAANTLIGIEKPSAQLSLYDTKEVKALETKLKKVRNKLFSAKSKETKLKYREEDKVLRNQIAEELEKSGWKSDTAQKLAGWDPYDQNASSSFFDSEWMFDIKDGFNVVIGNPPYVLLQERIKDEVDINWIRNAFKVASYKVDLYHLFYEKGINLLSKQGTLTYITPTNFLLNNYTTELRKLILETNLNSVLLLKNSVFEASVDTSVFSIIKSGKAVSQYVNFIEGVIETNNLNITPKSKIKRTIFFKNDFVINPEFDNVTLELLTLLEKGIKVGDIASVNFGMQLRNRSHFPDDVIQTVDKSTLSRFHKECYTGRDIKEFKVSFENRYCFFNREAQSGGCWDEKVQFAKNKLLVPQVGKYPVSGIDTKGFPVLNTAFMIVSKDKSLAYSLQAVINSGITKYYWLKMFYDQRQTFPKIKGTYLKEIPLPNDISNYSLSLISKIISYKSELKNSVLRDVLEGIIFELYVSDHMKERSIDILDIVKQDINEVMKGREFEKLSDSEKELVIEALHVKWSHPDNEVRNRIKLFAVRSPEILKPILES
ncbi:Eco57I restriction-modification methylase domain-containing protein [Peijinzhouia sedimentorum]